MNVIDIAIMLILVMFGLVGFKKGAIKEAISLIGIILVFIIAWNLKGTVGNWLCKFLPFFNFTGNLKGLVTLNILIYQMIAFAIISSLLYTVYRIILKLTGVIQKLVDMTIILLIPSKIIGFIIAFITGYITIFMILLVLLIPLKDVEIFSNSKVVNKMVYQTPILTAGTKNFSNTINETYTLIEGIKDKKISINEANLKIADTMLTYKVVSPHTLKQLQVLDKLNGVKDLNKVLDKYK